MILVSTIMCFRAAVSAFGRRMRRACAWVSTLSSSRPCGLGQVRHASKASGGATKYQARPSRPGPYQFEFEVDGLVKGGKLIKSQKWRYCQLGDREPEYHAGPNVEGRQEAKLYALKDGVMTVRQSRSNPKFKWVDVDPDIAKVKAARSLAAEYAARNEAFRMTEDNRNFAAELEELKDPDWRIRVHAPMRKIDRFPDPNTVVRGVARSATPKPRFEEEI
jgi:ribosomal protein L27